MTEQTDAAEVETLRADLANAECACGHQAEWHSALLGCNAEDWDQPACDCRGDWLDAVLPLFAAREAAAEARGAQAVLADLLTRTQESILSSGFRQEVVLASDVRAARAAVAAAGTLRATRIRAVLVALRGIK